MTFFFLFIYVVIIILGLLFTFAVLRFSHWLMIRNHLLYGPVFIPSQNQDLEVMIELAQPQKGEKIVDLGSGDGKVVIALAQKGFAAYGYENSPSLVWSSRRKIKQLGLAKKATIHWQDFWTVDFKQFDVIMMYTSQDTMDRLESRIRQQLKPGGRVVSNTFKFPHWPIKEQKGKIYLYQN